VTEQTNQQTLESTKIRGQSHLGYWDNTACLRTK